LANPYRSTQPKTQTNHQQQPTTKQTQQQQQQQQPQQTQTHVQLSSLVHSPTDAIQRTLADDQLQHRASTRRVGQARGGARI
jgi:hypothetical protein